MTWLRLDAALWTHPKITAVGERAAWLYVCGLCYAVLHSTEGFLPRRCLPLLSVDARTVRRSVGRLCDAGLWSPVDGGWEIHDFKDWQRTKEENPPSSRENTTNGPADLEHLRARADARRPARARAQARAGPPAGENRTEERREVPPSPPRGKRQRDLDRYGERLEAYAAEHFPAIANGRKAVHQAVTYGKAQTLDEVKAFIAEHWS